MRTGSRYILYAAAGMGIVSLGYFIALLVPIPFILLCVLVAAGSFFLFRTIERSLPPDEYQRLGRFSAYLLIGALIIITNKVFYLQKEYGDWDAWAIWNLHATYLSDPSRWTNLFLNAHAAHTDYPPGIPALVAFFSRICAFAELDVVSYAIHFLITLFIPLLIFFELRKRSIIIGGLALLLMATDEYYLGRGISMYADTPLAFFFLSAFVAMHHRELRWMPAIAGFMLGCCVWTKNEGIVLAGVFSVLYLPVLMQERRLWHFISGIALPLAVWAVFQVMYAPANDIVEGQGAHTWQKLQDWSRYRMIYDAFVKNMNEYFHMLKYGFALYLLWCVLKRRSPDRDMWIILCCAAAYALVYAVTPRELDWHLSTSQNRLMHQLMPATVYILAMRFSRPKVKHLQAEEPSVLLPLR